MISALYEGRLTHKRFATEATGQVAHEFSQRVTMAYLALDEIDQFFAQHPLWSAERRAPVRFDRADHLGDPACALDECVRDLVEGRLGRRPSGRVCVLTNLRTWGWLFNPLSVFYCFDGNEKLDAVVLEVTSTPWHERTAYVIDATTRSARFAKEMHVSPFLGMDHDYVVTFSAPSDAIHLHLGNRRGEERVFDAGLSLERLGSRRGDLAHLVWRRPAASFAVSAGIYRQALRLWRKGAPFVRRSRPLDEARALETTPR